MLREYALEQAFSPGQGRLLAGALGGHAHADRRNGRVLAPRSRIPPVGVLGAVGRRGAPSARAVEALHQHGADQQHDRRNEHERDDELDLRRRARGSVARAAGLLGTGVGGERGEGRGERRAVPVGARDRGCERRRRPRPGQRATSSRSTSAAWDAELEPRRGARELRREDARACARPPPPSRDPRAVPPRPRRAAGRRRRRARGRSARSRARRGARSASSGARNPATGAATRTAMLDRPAKRLAERRREQHAAERADRLERRDLPGAEPERRTRGADAGLRSPAPARIPARRARRASRHGDPGEATAGRPCRAAPRRGGRRAVASSSTTAAAAQPPAIAASSAAGLIASPARGDPANAEKRDRLQRRAPGDHRRR